MTASYLLFLRCNDYEEETIFGEVSETLPQHAVELALDFDGRVSWIRDQIFLPEEGASDEEILTRRRQLATSFDYRFSTGVSLSFGSIYNNVVNNRFRGGFF